MVLTGMTIDTEGNIYLAGSTSTRQLPDNEPTKPASTGSPDAFVTKMKAAGSELIYSTYLGGSDSMLDLQTSGIAIVLGSVYLAGITSSSDFPTVRPLQPAIAGRVTLL